MLESISGILAIMKELIKNFSLYKRNKKEELFDAIEAINRAANRTKIYYNNPDFHTEVANQELSDIWLEAARAVRNLDSDLYNRLLYKANFWAGPNDWTPTKSEKARIFIDDILEDVEKLRRIK